MLADPLFRCLVGGALIYGAWALFAPPSDPGLRIDRQLVDALRQREQRRSQRWPSLAESRRLVDSHIDDELRLREAKRLGLDQDDPIIFRRLIQKLARVEEATVRAPSDAELHRYIERNADRYRLPATLSFEQLFWSEQRHGKQAALLAQQGKARLAQGESIAADPSLLPRINKRQTRASIAGRYGEAFATRISGLTVGDWVGPIRSAFGQHLVRLLDKQPATLPPFSALQQRARIALLEQRRAAARQRANTQRRKRYRVEIDRCAFVSAGERIDGCDTGQ